MKKRRVLALLLALSLAVGMNGMTVLATAPDAAAVSSAAGEDSDAAEEGEQTEHMQQPETSGEGEQSAGQDSEGTAGDEEIPGPPVGVEGDTSVGDGSEDQRNPDGQIQDGGPEEGDQTDQPSEEDKTGSERRVSLSGGCSGWQGRLQENLQRDQAGRGWRNGGHDPGSAQDG